jgi:hypothetical protein
MEDQLSDWRINVLMTKVLDEMLENNKYVLATEVNLQMLVRLLKASPRVGAWLKANNVHWTWIERFLNARKAQVVYAAHAHANPH